MSETMVAMEMVKAAMEPAGRARREAEGACTAAAAAVEDEALGLAVVEDEEIEDEVVDVDKAVEVGAEVKDDEEAEEEAADEVVGEADAELLVVGAVVEGAAPLGMLFVTSPPSDDTPPVGAAELPDASADLVDSTDLPSNQTPSPILTSPDIASGSAIIATTVALKPTFPSPIPLPSPATRAFSTATTLWIGGWHGSTTAGTSAPLKNPTNADGSATGVAGTANAPFTPLWRGIAADKNSPSSDCTSKLAAAPSSVRFARDATVRVALPHAAGTAPRGKVNMLLTVPAYRSAAALPASAGTRKIGRRSPRIVDSHLEILYLGPRRCRRLIA